jgi:acyl dehydratase
VAKYEEFWGTELYRNEYTWDEDRVMLYAVGVGVGLDDPLRDLEFSTECTPGQPLKVLPTFLALLQRGFGWTSLLGWGDNPMMIRAVHGEHAITAAAPLPASGTAEMTCVLDGVFDKGSGALVVTTTHATLKSTGQYLGASRMSVFVQGKGGFGGQREVLGQEPVVIPQREPDEIVSLPVGVNQSLIYRLMGDHTPHGTHLDGARRDGFERPIYYGQGTFAYAGRALLRALCDNDVTRFGHLEGRFSKPVYPGDRLDTRIWRTDDGALFQIIAGGERVAFDRGRFRFAPTG